MSYILDALKKSEMQTRQGELPSINSSHVPTASGAHRPGWQYVLFGGIATGLLFGSMSLLGPETADTTDPDRTARATSGQIANEHPASEPATAPVIPSPIIANKTIANRTVPDPGAPGSATAPQPSAATEAIPNKPNIPSMHGDDPRTPSPTRPSASMTTAGKVEPEPDTFEATADRAQTSPLPMPDIRPQASDPPLLSELPVDLQQALPAIDIAGHIYDRSASRRMVFMNGQVRHEGDRITPALTLQAITADGVRLSFRDTSFRIRLFRTTSTRR